MASIEENLADEIFARFFAFLSLLIFSGLRNY
jgi:hypothetical protein